MSQFVACLLSACSGSIVTLLVRSSNDGLRNILSDRQELPKTSSNPIVIDCPSGYGEEASWDVQPEASFEL